MTHVEHNETFGQAESFVNRESGIMSLNYVMITSINMYLRIK